VVEAMRFVSQPMAFLKSCAGPCHFNRELVCDVVYCLTNSGRGHGDLRETDFIGWAQIDRLSNHSRQIALCRLERIMDSRILEVKHCLFNDPLTPGERRSQQRTSAAAWLCLAMRDDPAGALSSCRRHRAECWKRHGGFQPDAA
jgi:hypothetical protein